MTNLDVPGQIVLSGQQLMEKGTGGDRPGQAHGSDLHVHIRQATREVRTVIANLAHGLPLDPRRDRRITVIGSASVDYVMKVPTLPRRGETIADGDFLQTFGGKGANQAVAAARAGGKVTFASCLGQDLFAPLMLEAMRRDGIDTSWIRQLAGCESGTALVMFDAQGENYLTVAPGANDRLTPDRIRECEALIAASQILLLQMEIPVDSVQEPLSLARRHETPVLFNYAPIRNAPIPLTPAMTGLVVNEVEAGALLGRTVSSRDDAIAAALAIGGQGVRYVVVTLGANGAVIASDGQHCHVPAITVTKMGAQPSLPHRREIDAFLKTHPPGIPRP